MPRYTGEESTFRKALLHHLRMMHNFTIGDRKYSRGLTIEDLEELHTDSHMDKFMCPPHRHINQTDLDIGTIKIPKRFRNYHDEILRYRGVESFE